MKSSGILALDRVALAISSPNVTKGIWSGQNVTTADGKEVTAKSLPFDTVIERMIYGLSAAQLFNVDNIGTWLDNMHMTGTEAFRMMSELPTCVPPYPYTYMEWQDNPIRSSAFLMSGRSSDESGWRKCSIAVFDHHHSETYFLGTLGLTFTADGRVKVRDDNPEIPDVLLSVNPAIKRAMDHNGNTERLVQQQAALTVGIALFTCSLLHCKNVQETEVNPRDGLNRQQLRNAERTKKPMVVHKVLEINPLRKYRLGEDETEGEGEIRRLHHVRGHFSEYGPEFGKGLLFGRLSGRWYIPNHVRGDLKAGVVDKTYALRGAK